MKTVGLTALLFLIAGLASADPSAQQMMSGGAGSVSSGLVTAAGILLLATGSTLAVLWFLVRRWASSPRRLKTSAGHPDCMELPETPSISEAESADYEGGHEESDMQLPEEPFLDEEDITSTLLARNLSRGRGEINLARRLESASDTTKDLGTVIHGMVQDGSTGVQRIKAAKRLGIGKGEIDLALRLSEFQQRHGKVEKSNG